MGYTLRHSTQTIWSNPTNQSAESREIRTPLGKASRPINALFSSAGTPNAHPIICYVTQNRSVRMRNVSCRRKCSYAMLLQSTCHLKKKSSKVKKYLWETTPRKRKLHGQSTAFELQVRCWKKLNTKHVSSPDEAWFT